MLLVSRDVECEDAGQGMELVEGVRGAVKRAARLLRLIVRGGGAVRG